MQNTLIDAVGIHNGDCVAVVGAGGKTTLCWRLVQELAARDQRVIFTTTTKIWKPQDGVFDEVVTTEMTGFLNKSVIITAKTRTLCIAATIDGNEDNTPIRGAGMPSVQTKLAGFSPADVCRLKAIGPQWTMLVEADGARGLRLKAPGQNEPQIPVCANVVCVLSNLDAIGRPLDDRMVHRVDRVAQLAQTMPGSIITPGLMASVLTHPDGGLKSIPAPARKIAVLTQHSDDVLHPDAAALAAELRERGFDGVLVIAPRAPQSVLLALP